VLPWKQGFQNDLMLRVVLRSLKKKKKKKNRSEFSSGRSEFSNCSEFSSGLQ
jgi:hypothetical protein